MFKTIKYALGNDGVAVITIDCPGGANTISDDFRDDFAACVGECVRDEKVKGIVITSAKKDFVAGGDLNDMVEMFSRKMSAEEAYALATIFSPLLRTLETCGKPVAAAINGAAMGGGLEIALACHYRVVADDPKLLLGLPEVTLGLMPGAGGTQRLPRLIGIANALPFLLQGRPVAPAKALEMGIVHQVVPKADLVDAAKAWVLDHRDAQQPWDKKGFVIPGGAGFADADLGGLYNFNATQIALNTARNLPAPIALLTAVARGTCVPFDAGLHIEACEFAKLVLDPTARNMVRTLFVSKGELDKLKRRPLDVAPATFSKIGVLGAGLMGAGIAQVAAQAGLPVMMLDASAEKAAQGKNAIAASFSKMVGKGRMAQEKADAVLALIQPTACYDDLRDCDLVVEAVFEDAAVKAAVFEQAQAALKPTAILASNTSALPISALAEGLQQPQRFIGLHFFSPVDRMPLVEVVVGQQTDDATLAHALDFVRLLRKTPIVVRDSRGFFTSRVIASYLQEAFQMVVDGVAPVLVDNVARQAGFVMGPLALIDDIGLENGYRNALTEREILGSDPVGFALQHTLCAQLERTGRRAGKGIYDYVDGKRVPWQGISEYFPTASQQPDPVQVRQRLLCIQALEAARCYEEGVIQTATEGDVGSVLGIGFPAYTGGVLSYIDTLGWAQFIDICDQLADSVAERFRPSAWMRQQAANGFSFYAAADCAGA